MSLPSGTAIPLALTQAITIATAALPANTTCYFGAELPAYVSPLTFWISEITGDQKPAELGNQYRREEQFQLICSIVSYQGGVTDFPTLLSSLMTTGFIPLSQAIANNPTLNGTVRFAEVGNFHISPETDANGNAGVTLDFSIRCVQRVTSLN